MRKIFVSCILICILLVWLLPAQANENLSQRLQENYQGMEDFQADFEQELTNASSGEVETRKGKVKFRKPDLLRLETTEPEKELLLLDGEYVWQYFALDEVAYKYSLQDKVESETLLKLLTGDVEPGEEFVVQSQEEQENGLLKVVLEPRDPEPELVRATIWLDQKQEFVRKLILQDFFGNKNQIELSNLELDIGLDSDEFKFSPDQDVEVMDNTQHR
ncbi:MAG: outer membrane lipoprotein chaperone LolA [Thermodesulfobacteriota bacterium]